MGNDNSVRWLGRATLAVAVIMIGWAASVLVGQRETALCGVRPRDEERRRAVPRYALRRQVFAFRRNGQGRHAVRFLTFDADNPNSILSCLRAARENARSVREIISSEMWETINSLYHLVENA